MNLRLLWSGFCSLIFFIIGYSVVKMSLFDSIFPWQEKSIGTLSFFFIPLLLALIGFLLAFVFWNKLFSYLKLLLNKITSFSLFDIFIPVLGLLLGLIISLLITWPLSFLPLIGVIKLIPLLFNLVLGFLGVYLALKKKRDIENAFKLFSKFYQKASSLILGMSDRQHVKEGVHLDGNSKIIDTSVIIDGRIQDIWRTGFLEGKIIIPSFVIKEVQQLSDSTDPMKRARGKRALEILNSFKEEAKDSIIIEEIDYKGLNGVDEKLIKYAQGVPNSSIITNDYNLNQVASLMNIKVLNINDLANAVKAVVLPGEEISIQIVREGKTPGQGVGYLDDGTMVVIEDGKNYINSQVNITITSVLQTSSGRIVFGRILS
ncbi:PilT protein domain protein [Thermodesulfobium narugense DSM 14796]|uniref:PilT protein domain protein n=1 Tax=Thermodesulfobium narugense DSM 14796 TaxID=747365 RepID=M1E6L2_9BACT|nr:PIN domain-containing protein [Thermodesulfobium narugense]AEE14846.1 PilT protein domain protein [Thermodesulfobium narugense DSM 14796]